MYGLSPKAISTAFARYTLKAALVGNNKTSAAVVDQLSLAQGLSDARDAGPVYTKNARYVLMRELELFPAAALVQRQKPAAKTLFDGVEGIADDTL